MAALPSKIRRGRVWVFALLSFGVAYLGATLPAFLHAYPEITVDFALSDRKVDLVAEGFDLAPRIAIGQRPVMREAGMRLHLPRLPGNL